MLRKMRNLQDFSIPNAGEITLCEINGRVQSMNYDYANISTFTNSTENHPKVHITRDVLHPTGLGDEGRTLFVTTDVPFLKQLTQIYSEQGFIEALQTASYHDHVLLAAVAKTILNVITYSKKFRLFSNSSTDLSPPNLLNELSQTRNWSNHSIRCLAWHPHATRLAVATCDDSVRVYSSRSSFSPLLRCKQQKNVTSLAWRSNSLTEIAVGYEGGIIVWNVDFSSLVSRPSVSNTTMLAHINHEPVISMAWSPCGDVLATAAASDSNIIVWDVELNKMSFLIGSKDPGNSLLKWSPAKDKLLTVSNGIVFKIWDCRTWESERWTISSGRVQSACWANNGTHLLFATNSEAVIYGLTVKNDLVFLENDHAIPLFDLSKLDLDGVVVGGHAQCMDTDPKGTLLAVLFKDSNCVALFNVTKVPTLSLIASSLIVGLPAEIPSTIAFQQNFKSGACLSIGWSSGRIQHFPVIYSDLNGDVALNTTRNQC